MNLTKISIITGFLGVGKTTFIKQLLTLRPQGERWAIIVNEFGQVGVDALLLQDPSVQIKQVSGGCACCIAQLPFQLALNELLKPKVLDRIFIEPSGLGHADSLLKVLHQKQYVNWLTILPTITIIDPIQFQQNKYREHEIYQRQLKAADIIYINKLNAPSLDRGSRESDMTQAVKTITEYADSHNKQCIEEFQVFDQSILLRLSHIETNENNSVNTGMQFFKKTQSNDDGFHHAHFRPSAQSIYHYKTLMQLLIEKTFDRVKAVLNTDNGLLIINGVLDVINSEPYNGDAENIIIEVISGQPVSAKELEETLTESLLQSLIKKDKNDI